jgi:hypothetical protein
MCIRGLPRWSGQSLAQGGRALANHNDVFIAIDASKLRNAVAIAEARRNGKVRYLGEIDTSEAATKSVGRAPTRRGPGYGSGRHSRGSHHHRLRHAVCAGGIQVVHRQLTSARRNRG